MPGLKARLERLEAQRPENQERPFLRFWGAQARPDRVDDDLAEACRVAGVTLGEDDFVAVFAPGQGDEADFVPTIEARSSAGVKDRTAGRGFVTPDRINCIVFAPPQHLETLR